MSAQRNSICLGDSAEAFKRRWDIRKKDFSGQKKRGQCEQRHKRVAVPGLGKNRGDEAGVAGEGQITVSLECHSNPKAWISFRQLFLESSIIWPAFWKRGP